ncbi:hypothetical protein PISMIDRAFT_684904, partial [Pisolithus microcarpus 441]
MRISSGLCFGEPCHVVTIMHTLEGFFSPTHLSARHDIVSRRTPCAVRNRNDCPTGPSQFTKAVKLLR